MNLPDTETRIRKLLEYTRDKETLRQSFVKFSALDMFLQVTRKYASKDYRATIYMDDYPKQVVFRGYDDVDAVLQTLKFLEIFDAVAYRLEGKIFVFWRMVKETFPDCGTINAHGYDSDRPSWTSESKSLKRFRKQLKDVVEELKREASQRTSGTVKH